jgi:hypothetical protein
MVSFLLVLFISIPIAAGEKAGAPTSVFDYFKNWTKQPKSKKLKNYTIEQFLDAPEEELEAHKQLLDDLQKKGELNITPSQAHLFYPDPLVNRYKLEKRIKARIDKKYMEFPSDILSPGQLSALNKAMAEEQKIYDNGGATVYHSTQPDTYGHSYIHNKRHDFVLDILGTPVMPSKFLLLRDPICDRTDIESEKQKREEYLSQGISDDWSYRKDLLSCNLSLGNTTPGEASLDFWLDNHNVNRLSLDLGIGSKSQLIPRIYSLKEKVQKALQDFKQTTKTGVLLQIAFKNKKMIDDIMYHAKPFGFKKYYKIGEQKSKLEKPTNILDTMMQKPSEFSRDDIQEEQVRVVLTADKMLNATDPEIRHNVTINAYTDNQKALNKFHTQVDAAFARAKEDYVARQKTLPLSEQLWLKPNLFYKRAAKDLAD